MSENSRRDVEREQRFPCEQLEYTRTVGWLLPTILGEILTELGFVVIINPQQANGVDLEVYHESDLIFVAEVLNWSIASRLTDKRRDCIISNLNEYTCEKLLIHTVPLSNLDGFEENGTSLLQIGYQVLPRLYYDFFLTRRQVERRRMVSAATKNDIRQMIISYLTRTEFPIHH
ncbi:hypothetical protein E3J74_03490 [Candidatus Bathyarchaeota archaeon]|nr:MAG: hypothetical protein E3J74_03490 [Candidatus Bathyarchaeota archaeon]